MHKCYRFECYFNIFKLLNSILLQCLTFNTPLHPNHPLKSVVFDQNMWCLTQTPQICQILLKLQNHSAAHRKISKFLWCLSQIPNSAPTQQTFRLKKSITCSIIYIFHTVMLFSILTCNINMGPCAHILDSQTDRQP